MLNVPFREDFIHYLWKTNQIDLNNLVTTDGQPVSVLHGGYHNHDAGPDFHSCQITLNDTRWAGHIEIHIHSSDWNKHKHQKDAAYDNVILHVVYENDATVLNSKREVIPTIEIKDRFDENILKRYVQLIKANQPVSCETLLHNVKPIHISMWKSRLIADRLEAKSRHIKTILDRTVNDWERTFFIVLARYMGARANTDAFEALANSLPFDIILKNNDSLIRLEALLFGNAGFLEDSFEDEYYKLLQSEYSFLRKKYSLEPIPLTMWKFLRMRPSNFPTIRIAQFAALLHNNTQLFTTILPCEGYENIQQLFSSEASVYWDNRYQFKKESSAKRKKKLTTAFIDLLMINVICPTLFLYGIEKGIDNYQERAISLLEKIKPEKNSIISEWNRLGLHSTSAMDSQSLLHLRKNYCDVKRCLDCAIGSRLINQ